MAAPTLVRMPPSPTGQCHLGTARTLLMNYIFARSTGGEYIYRSEDTDQERSTPENEAQILQMMSWLLGTDCKAGAKELYRQTEHTPLYQHYLEKLWESGHLFACFTSAEELQLLRDRAETERENFVFWSPDRDLPLAEQRARIAAGESCVYRLRCPRSQTLTFTDAIKGEISVESDTLGDFVVARSDGTVLYLLANVIDDWHDGITHIIRGEDHLANTPKQLLVYRALEALSPGLQLPVFAHIPLVVDHEKRKLSKRRALPGMAVMVHEFIEQGFVPEAVANGLMMIGWNPKSTQEIFSVEEMAAVFSLSQVQRAAAQYDFEKMQWYNQQWCARLSDVQLTGYYQQWQATTGQVVTPESPLLTRALRLSMEKARTFRQAVGDMQYLLQRPRITLAEITQHNEPLTEQTVRQILLSVQETLSPLAGEVWTAESIKAAIVATIQHSGLKTRDFMPVWREAMSGQTPSAGPIEIALVVGKAETLARTERLL
ncbi:glutamate--tRNA ligase [Candidatus Peribacteria bacterium]|nr:glutamate--tRNA ligase [Candidatus Peribacteria bacterium]